MERLIQWVAWKLPRRVAYWAAIRVLSKANNPFDSVEALKKWEAQAKERHG